MNKRRALQIAVACLMLSAHGILFAQDAAPDQNAPRRILVVLEQPWSLLQSYSGEQMAILERSLLTALSEVQGGPEPVPFGFLKSFPSSLKERNRVASEAGADCWLWVKIAGFKFSPSIRVVSYDLIYDITTLDFMTSRSEPFPIMDIYRERWDDIASPVAKKYPALGPEVYSRGPPAPVTVTLHAHPGTQITGLTPAPLVIGPDGTVSVELPSPAPYALRANLVGYVSTGMTFYLDGQMEISLDQTKSPWLYIDAAFLDGVFPGVAATYAVPTFPGFVRVGFATFRAGIAVNQDKLLTSLPLSQFTLLLGWYFTPGDSPTRFYAGAGPLLRVTLPPGGSLTYDHLLPWGIQAVAGLEFGLAGSFHAFIEYAPTIYSTPEPEIFKASFGKDNTTLPYLLFHPSFALDPFEVRFGVRWML